MVGFSHAGQYQYQALEQLQRVILEDFDPKIPDMLEDLCKNPDVHSPARRVVGALMERLLDYCSYSIAPAGPDNGVVDCFDDPYVGAALITEEGKLLGAHRKEKRNEAHAEPNAILGALSALGTREASRLMKAIKVGYRDVAWLQSEDKRDEFIENFRVAGELVRQYIREAGLGCRLMLLSTLEPCKDFETQPGCSHLISAFRPDLVIYACDDTNAKGQGRPVLLASKIPVIFNVAPEKNIKANRLFYSSVHYLKKIYAISQDAPNPFQTRYTAVQLDRLSPEIQWSGDRIIGVFNERDPFRTYEAPVELEVSNPGVRALPSPAPPSNDRALFINNLDPFFISYFFHAHLSAMHFIPGILVASRLKNVNFASSSPDSSRLINVLKKAGVRVYTNVLRRAEEEVLARQYVRRWAESGASLDQLYAVVKMDKAYEALPGGPDEILESLIKTKGARRVILTFDSRSRTPVLKLLKNLRIKKAFDPGRALAKTSFELIVSCPSHEMESEERFYASELQSQALASRFSVSAFPRSRDVLTVDGIFRELIEERLDPILTVTSVDWQKILNARNWKERQAAGMFLVSAAHRDPTSFRQLIIDRIPDDFRPGGWRELCSLLNAVDDFGITRMSEMEPDRERLLQKLGTLANSLDEDLALSDNPEPIYQDIVWRLLSATCSVAREWHEFERIIIGSLHSSRKHLIRFIAINELLMKDLLLYAAKSEEARDFILDWALEIFVEFSEYCSDRHQRNVLLRAARLARILKNSQTRSFAERVEVLLGLSNRDFMEEAHAEQARIDCILEKGLAGVFSSPDLERPKLFAAYLFVRASGPKQSRGGLPESLDKDLSGNPNLLKSLIPWRGHKTTTLARLVLSEAPKEELFYYLAALASDEDATIQWAALVLTMDKDYRLRQLGHGPSRQSHWELRGKVALIVEATLHENTSYWLHREFLYQYLREHSDGALERIPSDARLQICDVPSGRSILWGNSAIAHPEIEEERHIVQRLCKRVLLVLPPLQVDFEEQSHGAASSTPPLGLGSIASHLSSNGHDVRLLDCHRFPWFAQELPELALKSDVVGFGVVTSTFQSTKEIIALMQRRARSKKNYKIVLGGQAVTLHSRLFQEDIHFDWDYLVLGDGEHAFLEIVRSLGREEVPEIPGVISRYDSEDKISKPCRISSAEWDNLQWIDRGMFADPKGIPYEPVSTRNSSYREAHIVMSRGCSWHCTFCTEAIIRGKDGEVRRSARDILDEIDWLVKSSDISRVQFVDDNLLPQIAAPRANIQKSLDWSVEFLEGLRGLRSFNPNLGWRGIFRLEDFWKYQELLGGDSWYALLRDAGCTLLAFGIEHGLEERRKNLKIGLISNDNIVKTVEKLKGYQILSKGYFIIGGHMETVESAQATIDFATSSGLTLAYFALYKGFRLLAVNSAAKSSRRIRQQQEQLTQFQVLTVDFERLTADNLTEENCRELFGRTYGANRIQEAVSSIRKLNELGFSFLDLFKYNDYHEDLDEINDLVHAWNAARNEVERYFLQAVRRAYFDFYARGEFVNNYRMLTERGY